MNKKLGISVLMPTQNEEAIVELSITSFLDFADELIVVDNGSTDNTKIIIKELESRYPPKIKFYDKPDLIDLYQNRQFAFEKSSFSWVVRADSDYVAYTTGSLDITLFKRKLLSTINDDPIIIYGIPQPNVTGDFWHTGIELLKEKGKNEPGRYVPPPFTPGFMMRIYKVFPDFRFVRLGRWEGIENQDYLRKKMICLDYPLWMHCNIKSEENYFYRSERTNWREQGDFVKYPTLETYIREIIRDKWGTDNIAEAAGIYFRSSILPFLQFYDPKKYWPYPSIIEEQMKTNPIYKIQAEDGTIGRKKITTAG